MNTPRTTRLAGKVALVTGAGNATSNINGDIGNGCAAAVLLARAGARVALVDMNREWAENTRRMIEADCEDVRERVGADELELDEPRVITIVADVTSPSSCEDAILQVRKTFSRLDILVNIVGIAGPDGTAVDIDIDAWDRGIRVNLTSMVLMAKFAIPEMLRTAPKDKSKGTGKAIVNMSSVAGLQGGHHALFYPTTKGAIVNMTTAMAAHHALDGIRVNAVAPGMIYTPMVSKGPGQMSDLLRKTRAERSLLKIEGYAWDVANAIVFLASEEARWITGVTLVVDAGATAGYTPGKKFGEPGVVVEEKSKL